MPHSRPVVERLVAALKADPQLARAVVTQVKVLDPWEAVGKDWFHRADAVFEFNVATVRLERGTWLWSEFIPLDSGSEEIANRGGFATAEEAKVACDAHLVTRGWTLLTST